jgi:hypothetical protein
VGEYLNIIKEQNELDRKLDSYYERIHTSSVTSSLRRAGYSSGKARTMKEKEEEGKKNSSGYRTMAIDPYTILVQWKGYGSGIGTKNKMNEKYKGLKKSLKEDGYEVTTPWSDRSLLMVRRLKGV